MLCSITDFIETDPWRDTDQFINRSSIQRMLNQEINPNCCFGWALRSSGRENKSLRKSRESPESWSSSGKESPFASKRRHTSSMNWKNGLECLSQSGRDNECTKNLRNLRHKLLSKAQRHHLLSTASFALYLNTVKCSTAGKQLWTHLPVMIATKSKNQFWKNNSQDYCYFQIIRCPNGGEWCSMFNCTWKEFPSHLVLLP